MFNKASFIWGTYNVDAMYTKTTGQLEFELG